MHACFKCFICFRRMLQVFHLDVSKVDLWEAHAMLLVHHHGSPRAPAGGGGACM
jgi:hypothetical protein